jgi:hypothetical protein
MIPCYGVGNDESRKNATDQYRPSVGTMPSDDIPLIVKGAEELPARSGGPRLSRHVQCSMPIWATMVIWAKLRLYTRRPVFGLGIFGSLICYI